LATPVRAYTLKRPFRPQVEVTAASTWELRRKVRDWLGWQGSARYRYKQIGSNSFLVEWGPFTVAEVYLNEHG
jgi:hypothetical protein